MISKRLLLFPLALMIGVSCSGETPEAIAEIEAAVTSGSFSLGNTASIYTTTGFGVQYMYKEADFLHTPVGAESSASWWTDVWQVDNGGTCTIPQNPIIGPDGIHGSGTLNQVRFRIERNNSYGGIDTDTVSIDFTYSDGISLCIYRPSAVSVTAPGHGVDLDRNKFQMTWANGSAQIFVMNENGGVIAQSDPYAFIFPGGTGVLTKVHSPQTTVRMDTSQQFGGCMRDVPDYDGDPSADNWHYREHNLFGVTAPSFAAYLSAPLSQTHCSLTVVHDSAHFQDVTQGHQDGF